MAKASIILESGGTVHIEGSTTEIRELLAIYGAAKPAAGSHPKSDGSNPATKASGDNARAAGQAAIDLVGVVNHVKSCEEAESIEKEILDKTAQVPRVLLPLYVIHEHMANAFGLTSGEISKVTTELGIPVGQANASKTLSGSASQYVVGDKVRKNGQPVRYKLSRRGVAHLKNLITGKQ